MRIIVGLIIFSLCSVANASEVRQLQTKVQWSKTCLKGGDSSEPSTQQFVAAGAALVAILGPKIIAGAIDSAATALKNAGQDKEVAKVNFSDESAPYAVTSGGDLVIPPDMQCVDIYWGRLDQNNNTTKDFVLAFQARVDQLKGSGVSGYFRLTPTKLNVGEFAQSSFFSASKRHYTISLTLSVPGADKPFASTSFTFKDVPTGEFKPTDATLAADRSDILAFPAASDSAKRAQSARVAEIAPYVLAQDIVQKDIDFRTKPQRFKPMPSVYSETGIPANVDAYCKVQDSFNKTHLDQFALNDDLCAYTVASAKQEITKTLAGAGRSGKTLAWAKGICSVALQERENKGKLVAAAEQPNCPYPDLPMDVAQKRYGIMTTTVTIVEIRPGNKFAEFLGNTLASAKDDLAKDIATRTIPSLRDAADAADSASDRTARRGIKLADLKVQSANDLLSEVLAAPKPKDSDVTAARAALFQAQIAANDAYRLAGETPPYPAAD